MKDENGDVKQEETEVVGLSVQVLNQPFAELDAMLEAQDLRTAKAYDTGRNS